MQWLSLHEVYGVNVVIYADGIRRRLIYQESMSIVNPSIHRAVYLHYDHGNHYRYMLRPAPICVCKFIDDDEKEPNSA